MITELEYRADCDKLSAAEMIKKYGIGCFTLVEEEFKPGMLPEHFQRKIVIFQNGEALGDNKND